METEQRLKKHPHAYFTAALSEASWAGKVLTTA